MSTVIVAAAADVIAQAFEQVNVLQAPQAGFAGGTPRAYSLANEVEGALGDAWVKIRALVEKCSQKGRAIVRSEVETFMQYMETTCRELGAHAREFRERLLGKIREMISSTFAVMLRAMHSELTVGDRKLALKSINLEQKLIFSGSLQISLTSLCEFAGGGELTIVGSYEAIV